MLTYHSKRYDMLTFHIGAFQIVVLKYSSYDTGATHSITLLYRAHIIEFTYHCCKDELNVLLIYYSSSYRPIDQIVILI